MNVKKRRSLAIGISALCLTAALLTFPINRQPSHAQSRSVQLSSGQGVTGQTTTKSQGPFRNVPSKRPPIRALGSNSEGSDEREIINAPVDPRVRLEDIHPTNAESVARVNPELLSEKPQPQPVPQAAGTFTLFRNTTLASAAGR